MKIKKLNLGSNIPKSFEIFSTIAINYNAIFAFHQDLNNHPNSLCIVCSLRSFESGQLVFPELKLVIYIKQEQAIAFRSHILVYENLTVTANNQYSIIFFIYSTVIKQN